MSTRNRAIVLVVSVALAGLQAASSVPAQDGPRSGEREPAGRFSDEVTVRAEPLQQIDLRSLEAERTALPLLEVSAPDRLGRFPDRDAAGAARRLPGLTVIPDQGDARLVLVRGFLPAFSSATLDGERIPAGEGDERAVALDLVPTELLESIEVRKTPTPDMDGDAIGGTVELTTRRPPAEPRLAVSTGVGHDDGSDGTRALATASVGRTLTSGLGFHLAASHRAEDRGVDSLEIRREGDEIDERRLQDHEVLRRRSGAAATVHWAPRESTELRLRALWSGFEDLERRRARVLRFDGDETLETRELKDRPESQDLLSVAISSAQQLAADWSLSWRIAWARAEEEDPNRLDTLVVEDDGRLVLEGFRTEEDRAANEDLVVAFDLERPMPRGRWQVGAKWRQKEVRRDENLRGFELDDDLAPISLDAIGDPAWRPADPFFGGRLDLVPAGEEPLFPDPRRARRLFADLSAEGVLDLENDAEEDFGDFEAEEDTVAAYGLVELEPGAATTLLVGARLESTETDSLGAEIAIGSDADNEDTADVVRVPSRGGGSYAELLPSVVLRHAPTETTTLRAAASRTLARPDLETLAPSRLVLVDDEEIVLGNPDLVPTTSWNLDLGWRRTLGPLGSLSATLYAKQLDDVIVDTRTVGDPDAEGTAAFTVVEPRNAGDATVVGLELAVQNRFRSLPHPFDGLGIAANLTWADSEAELFGRPAMPLPGQAELSGNLVLSYETRRVSARILYSYRDEIIEELGENAALDVHLEARGQLDLSAQVRLATRWSLVLEAFNLSDEPVRSFEGSPNRPLFEERGGWWASVGARFDY